MTQTNNGFWKSHRIFLTVVVIGMIVAFVLGLSSCVYAPEPASYGPAMLSKKRVETYKHAGKRYVYTLKVERQGRVWNYDLLAECKVKDESLPSRDFRALDFGWDGSGFDYFRFYGNAPISDFEYNLYESQANRVFELVYQKKNLVSVREL